MGPTERLARFVVETGYDDFPQEVVSRAKLVILDSFGVMLAGSREPVGRIITDYVRELGAAPRGGVIGAGFRTAPPLAALANGTMAHALDYDDRMHMSTHTLPALLALGEERGICGKKALEAYILGREIRAKLDAGIDAGRAFHWGPYARGWHSTGTTGAVASAAAAGKVLGLKLQQMRRALGIAASSAAGLRRNFGTMTKPLHAGNAARNGVEAALLAAKGFSADEAILEAPLGLVAALCQEGECDWKAMTETLGHPYDLEAPGPRIKPYPSCTGTHRALEGLFGLLRQHSLGAQDVATIECDLHPQGSLCRVDPQEGVAGKFSMGFCLAVGLLEGRVVIEQFTDEKVRHPAVREVMGQIVHVPQERPRGTPEPPERITLKLRDGREYTALVPRARDLVTQDEIEAKYRDCAQRALSAADAERLLQLVTSLEEVEDISALMELACSRAPVLS